MAGTEGRAMKCVICDDLIEAERINLGFSKCKGCAFLHPEEKVKGAMVYLDKTGGAINVMSPESFDNYKRISRRVGQRSALRNVLDNGGRSQ
jgi:hypothetical protein